MKELPIIQSLWIGDKLTVMERLCISSFLKNGHPFHLYTYSHIEGIPPGTTIKDANDIIPSDMIFKYQDHDSYAGFSDLFRYKLLFDKGGYWVDTDNVCLHPFANQAEYVFSSQRAKGLDSNPSQMTNNGVINVPKGSIIMEYCYNEALSKDKNKLKWGDTGPKLIARAVKKFALDSYVTIPKEFCSIDWWNWNQFIDGSVDKSILEGARSVHLWNEMWRRNKVDKEAQFEKNSLYEYLKKIYLNSTYDEKRPVYRIKENLLLNQNDINTIRDSAIGLENTNLILAHNLMSIAHKARPSGGFIKQKLKQYEQQINKKIES